MDIIITLLGAKEYCGIEDALFSRKHKHTAIVVS